MRITAGVAVCLSLFFLSGCESPPGVEYTYYSIPSSGDSVDSTPMTIQVAPAAAGTQAMNNGLYPGILFIHGGSWEQGSKQDMYGDMRAAVAGGYVAASVNYRLSKPSEFSVYGTWPAPLEDVKCAIRWLRANAADGEKGWNLDPENIAVVGISAGGHLALMVAETSGLEVAGEPVFETPNCNLDGAEEQSSEVAVVATMSGIGDINQLWERDEFNARNGLLIQKVEQLLGGLDLSGEGPHTAVAELNPIEYVVAQGPPVLMVHPENDGVVSPKAEARYPDQGTDPVLGYHELLQSVGRTSMFINGAETHTHSERDTHTLRDNHTHTDTH